MNAGRLLRIGAAVAILISGIVHLDLYFNAYYFAQDALPNFSRSLLLNSIASGILTIALVWRTERLFKLGGILFSLSTLGAFFYSHTEHSLLGFSHAGPVFDPSPQAKIVVILAIVAILLLAASWVPAIETKDLAMPVPAVGVAFAITAVALIGVSLRWHDNNTSTNAPGTTTATTVAGAPTAASTASTVAGGVPASGPQAIEIKDFKFGAGALTVVKGTTVTWTNADSDAHTVVASDKSFKSNNLDQGATFKFTFNTPGTFAYICGIHNFMKGTITVTG